MANPKKLEITGTRTVAPAGTLHLAGGAANLTLTGTDRPDRLYQAHFQGLIPTITEENGAVTVRYRRRLHPFATDRGEGTIELSTKIPWSVHVHDAAAAITANLADITLAGIIFDSAVADITLDLPRPEGEVTIRIAGPTRDLHLRRAVDIPVGVSISGGASRLRIDGEEVGATRGHHTATPPNPDRYTLIIDGTVDGLTVTHERRIVE